MVLPRSQPVHVVYGGAHLYSAHVVRKLGERALAALDTWGNDAPAFARAMGLDDPSLAAVLHERVRTKLQTAPVEALCIDFEDGYGYRTDAEEDADAVRTARELATAPPGALTSMRIKSIGERGARTLDLFLTTLAKESGGVLPHGFTITLPKIAGAPQVVALVTLLERLEGALGLPRGQVGIELMIETPRALIDADGRIALPALVAAAGARCVAVHLGAYDLTAALGVTGSDQRLDHPFCDHARALLQFSLGGSGIPIFDGATTQLPIPSTGVSEDEKRATMFHAWGIHARNVRAAIRVGIFQGWDLHPAQLPARFGALHAYFLQHREALGVRLSAFLDRAAQASRVGQEFDDAATAQGLVSFFARGVACGALDAADLEKAGLGMEELALGWDGILATRSTR